MNPRVSVVTIFFNAAEYLGEAIESVRAQDFADWELLLVDDGSTDESLAIAERFADGERIRILHHPGSANRGMSASRNLGIRRASGELVAFIDADDRWRPNKLSEQVALLDRFPEVDMVCGATNFWSSHKGGENQIIPSGHAFNRPIRPPEALLKVYPLGRANPPCPSDLLVRRPVVDAVGGFEESFVGPLQLYEDQAFLTKLYLAGTVYFSDRVWLDYRVHDSSCTTTVNANGLQPQVRRHCLDWLQEYLSGTPFRYHLGVRWALMRALRPYRHPHLSRLGRAAKSFLRHTPPLTRRATQAGECR